MAETLTVEAGISPLLTFWTAHLIVLSAGVYFFRQSALERPVPLVGWLDRSVLALKRLVKSHAHP